MELFQASKQWAQRPPDERFWGLDDMLENARASKMFSDETVQRPGSLNLVAPEDSSELMLNIGFGEPLALTNWSFGQLCQRLKAPADFLIGLDSPELAASCLNRRKLLQAHETKSCLMVYHRDQRVNALTSDRYARIYDADILARLVPLSTQGWHTPPARAAYDNDPRARPATVEDIQDRSSVQVGEMIAPAGLYRGDRDMFVFMVNTDVRIDDGTDEGLSRGFFVRNSEVGAASFSFTEFAYRHVCGNHIVWGAQDVREVRLRHIGQGKTDKALHALACELKEYAQSSVSDDEALIARAKNFVLGDDKDEVLDFLFGKRLMTRKLAEQAYETCVEQEPQLNPRSVWGIVQGVTRVSQEQAFANKRTDLDNITPKLLERVA